MPWLVLQPAGVGVVGYWRYDFLEIFWCVPCRMQTCKNQGGFINNITMKVKTLLIKGNISFKIKGLKGKARLALNGQTPKG